MINADEHKKGIQNGILLPSGRDSNPHRQHAYAPQLQRASLGDKTKVIRHNKRNHPIISVSKISLKSLAVDRAKTHACGAMRT